MRTGKILKSFSQNNLKPNGRNKENNCITVV
jgi:hypothetical protein